jgi:DNA repair protein RecO
MSKLFQTQAIVLKRHNFNEADRFITFFSLSRGKFSALAKGVRKITSRKRASLEPLNQVKLSIVEGKTFIVAEASLVNSFPEIKQDFSRLTQANSLIEIIDMLIAEEEPHPAIYQKLHHTLSLISTNGKHKEALVEAIRFILQDLGFGLPDTDSEADLKDHIEQITQKSLKSKSFMTSPLTNK